MRQTDNPGKMRATRAAKKRGTLFVRWKLSKTRRPLRKKKTDTARPPEWLIWVSLNTGSEDPGLGDR
jgi:hypothetical protein